MRGHSHNFRDLTGQRFGRVTVLEFVEQAVSNRGARWLCKCDCGTRFVVDATNLTSGRTRSCGCFRREVAARTLKVNNVHNKPARP